MAGPTAARFARMKRDGYFINVGRGATTKLDDLAEAVVDALEPMMVKGKARPVVVYKVLRLRRDVE